MCEWWPAHVLDLLIDWSHFSFLILIGNIKPVKISCEADQSFAIVLFFTCRKFILFESPITRNVTGIT